MPSEKAQHGAEPVAYFHTMHMELGQKLHEVTKGPSHPWGWKGVDFDESYEVTTTPLYPEPPRPRTMRAMPEQNPAARVWMELAIRYQQAAVEKDAVRGRRLFLLMGELEKEFPAEIAAEKARHDS